MYQSTRWRWREKAEVGDFDCGLYLPVRMFREERGDRKSECGTDRRRRCSCLPRLIVFVVYASLPCGTFALVASHQKIFDTSVYVRRAIAAKWLPPSRSCGTRTRQRHDATVSTSAQSNGIDFGLPLPRDISSVAPRIKRAACCKPLKSLVASTSLAKKRPGLDVNWGQVLSQASRS